MDARAPINISVVGLGKIGACMAACFAQRGFPTIGVDVNPQVVQSVNEGKPPVFELGLEEVMVEAREQLRSTDDYKEAVHGSKITFIVVPTPSESHDGYSVRYIREAAEKIGEALRDKVDYHLVVLTSTVLPGSTESVVIPSLERESGRRLRKDFGVCYNPAFIALGSVIHNLLNPDFILVGESDPQAGETLVAFYRQLCGEVPPVERMNLVNAELAKIAVNTYVTMKITFANMIGNLCEKLPGADVDVVASAIGLDRRIGSRFLKGGLGYGGPCFPRDNAAFAYLARQLGACASIAEATDQMNRAVVKMIVKRVLSLSKMGAIVAVLGLAYKPGTHVVEESQGLEIAYWLSKEGMNVVVHDPFALQESRKFLGDEVRYCGSVSECVEKASVVVIANPLEEYKKFFLRDVSRQSFRGIVVDCWRILTPASLGKDIRYVGLGLGYDSEESRNRLKSLYGSFSI
ncbi:MAG: UDP-glucose dehydrogenase family protein [Nitrospinota bacterium]